ncbi:MAG: alpha/beta fold hydrolase [Geminicoccaceae bacterium]
MHVAQAEGAWRTEDPNKLTDFYRGIKAYRSHPYRRTMPERPTVWQRGSSRLSDYGPKEGWPLLVVPSLINRAYIVDLMPDASLLAFLSQGGIRPLLMDWGEPDLQDRQMSLDRYIVERLEPAVDWLLRETGRKPLVLGYCMGGTLAAALAARKMADLAGLALLAAPWDFWEGQRDFCNGQLRSDDFKAGSNIFSRLSSLTGSASVDQLQTLFAAIDLMAVPRKFARFARLDPTSAEAERFVAIEDWLNDGVPLGADLAMTCMLDWYADNAPALGQWTVAGRAVLPETIDLPAFLAIPARDRIVPAQSALALAAALPRAKIIRPASGHIGMVTGRRARPELFQPLLAWLQHVTAMQTEIVAMQKKSW